MADGEVSPSEPTAPVGGGAGTDPPRSGDVIAERYLLRRVLGRGGHGEVWEGRDLSGGGTIAVKLFHRWIGGERARALREILALRLLQGPGVVRLLDEGMEGELPFLVMERVEGTAFPGEGRARRWESMEEVALALVETLGRIHAAGVVHRDLKPENVLVRRGGKVTVLDFGISTGDRLGSALPLQDGIVGTPRYLAPEQILGEAVTARTDLYALGLLLYEALAGELPHSGGDRERLLQAQLGERAAPLLSRVRRVPCTVARAVDRLLSRDPDRRPRSAAEVREMLRGEAMGWDVGASLPRFDREGPMKRLMEAARAGRSVDLVGIKGTGRTRCLHDFTEALEREGRRVAWAAAARRALGSLEPVIGTPDARLRIPAEATELVEARLRAALGGGLVVVVDDAEEMDRWSAEVIGRCRAAGTIVRALVNAPEGARGEAVVRLEPLDAAALEGLFSGPERIFRLRSDAARALWARTEGLQVRVAEEVSAWLRAGFARWDGQRLAVDREALDRLEAVLWTKAPEGQQSGHRALALRLAQEGRVGQAVAALEEGLSFARRSGAPAEVAAAEEERLLALWVEVALWEWTPVSLSRALYEVCRAERRTAAIARLEELSRAAVAFGAGGDRAAALVDRVAPFAELELERLRQWLRVAAARRRSLAAEEATVEEVAAWAAGAGDAGTEARVAGWLGELRCRQGRFEEAVRLEAEAAERAPWVTWRIEARLTGAAALLEGARYREAAEWAEAARDQARACRHALLEVKAEWILRRAAYRSGAAMRPDLELVEAAARTGVDELEAGVCAVEAAVALRAGEQGCAVDLAERSLGLSCSIDTEEALEVIFASSRRRIAPRLARHA